MKSPASGSRAFGFLVNGSEWNRGMMEESHQITCGKLGLGAFTRTGVEIELVCNMIPSLDTNAFSQHHVEERDPE